MGRAPGCGPLLCHPTRPAIGGGSCSLAWPQWCGTQWLSAILHRGDHKMVRGLRCQRGRRAARLHFAFDPGRGRGLLGPHAFPPRGVVHRLRDRHFGPFVGSHWPVAWRVPRPRLRWVLLSWVVCSRWMLGQRALRVLSFSARAYSSILSKSSVTVRAGLRASFSNKGSSRAHMWLRL